MTLAQSDRLPSVDRLIAEIIEIRRAQGRAPDARWTADTTLEEAKIDSLALVELLFELEDRHGVTIEFNANSAEKNLVTIRDIAVFAHASLTAGEGAG